MIEYETSLEIGQIGIFYFIHLFILAHWKFPVGRQVVIVSEVRMCLRVSERCG